MCLYLERRVFNSVLTRGAVKVSSEYILSVCGGRRVSPFFLVLHLWKPFMGPEQEQNSSLEL